MVDFDVIVVGGGPAGTVSAIECSQLGLDVLLIEKEGRGRHKPCGGVLTPACVDLISETLRTSMPRCLMCSPNSLGLYYVPPSGRRNGGSPRNYRLLNINRDLFDLWLIDLAEKYGVQVWNETEFLKLEESKPIQICLKRDGRVFKMSAQYLIGADGVYSKVRRQLYGVGKGENIQVLQEHYRAKGEFNDYFYMFLQSEVSPTYSYVIPKDDLYVIGVGALKTHSKSILECMKLFKNWLREEFSFKPQFLRRRELWAIPCKFTFNGKGDIILAGDAAGFCNAFSGEGIRLAFESGIAAGEAVKEALSSGNSLASIYMDRVNWINNLVKEMYNLVINLTDKDREEFVKSELARISLA
jgi:geranylgeranyl reductase family protein